MWDYTSLKHHKQPNYKPLRLKQHQHISQQQEYHEVY